MVERLGRSVNVVLARQEDEDVARRRRPDEQLQDGPHAGVDVVVRVRQGVVDLDGVLPAADVQDRAPGRT